MSIRGINFFSIIRGVAADVLKSPRGIRGFQLDVGNFTEWRVQGKVGGYKGYFL